MNRYTRLILLTLLCTLLYLWWNKNSDSERFSSQTSPNGNWVAENFYVDGCVGECATGLISLHQLGNGAVFKFGLKEPMPDVFFQWVDDSHLRILTQNISNAAPLNLPDKLGGIFLTHGTYSMLNAADATARAKKVETYSLPANNVSATFSTASYAPMKGTTCKLQIKANDANTFDKIGVDLTVHFGQACYSGLTGNCGGMDSNFSVGNSLDRSANWMLTSADVVNAHGYGVLSTGADHKAIRGQFLDKNAITVRNALNTAFFEVVYNFNFDARSV
jgi:hypothetical protein